MQSLRCGLRVSEGLSRLSCRGCPALLCPQPPISRCLCSVLSSPALSQHPTVQDTKPSEPGPGRCPGQRHLLGFHFWQWAAECIRPVQSWHRTLPTHTRRVQDAAPPQYCARTGTKLSCIILRLRGVCHHCHQGPKQPVGLCSPGKSPWKPRKMLPRNLLVLGHCLSGWPFRWTLSTAHSTGRQQGSLPAMASGHATRHPQAQRVPGHSCSPMEATHQPLSRAGAQVPADGPLSAEGSPRPSNNDGLHGGRGDPSRQCSSEVLGIQVPGTDDKVGFGTP